MQYIDEKVCVKLHKTRAGGPPAPQEKKAGLVKPPMRFTSKGVLRPSEKGHTPSTLTAVALEDS